MYLLHNMVLVCFSQLFLAVVIVFQQIIYVLNRSSNELGAGRHTTADKKGHVFQACLFGYEIMQTNIPENYCYPLQGILIMNFLIIPSSEVKISINTL